VLIEKLKYSEDEIAHERGGAPLCRTLKDVVIVPVVPDGLTSVGRNTHTHQA